MKKARKALLTLCAALLLVTMTAGVTVAYLTSQDTVTNTFTTGKVEITLDEAPVDETGKEKDGDRVKTNDYKIYPGGSYDKDPTVHVNAASEDAWLRVKVTFVGGAAADGLGLPLENMLQNLNAGFTFEKQPVTGDDVVYIATYGTKIKANDDIILFDGIKIPDSLTNADLEKLNGVKMEIVAYAVQADGFNNPADAFAEANLGV